MRGAASARARRHRAGARAGRMDRARRPWGCSAARRAASRRPLDRQEHRAGPTGREGEGRGPSRRTRDEVAGDDLAGSRAGEVLTRTMPGCPSTRAAGSLPSPATTTQPTPRGASSGPGRGRPRGDHLVEVAGRRDTESVHRPASHRVAGDDRAPEVRLARGGDGPSVGEREGLVAVPGEEEHTGRASAIAVGGVRRRGVAADLDRPATPHSSTGALTSGTTRVATASAPAATAHPAGPRACAQPRRLLGDRAEPDGVADDGQRQPLLLLTHRREQRQVVERRAVERADRAVDPGTEQQAHRGDRHQGAAEHRRRAAPAGSARPPPAPP